MMWEGTESCGKSVCPPASTRSTNTPAVVLVGDVVGVAVADEDAVDVAVIVQDAVTVGDAVDVAVTVGDAVGDVVAVDVTVDVGVVVIVGGVGKMVTATDT